jgi:hypothetical protein
VTPELVIVVPTRSRPHHVAPLIEAWIETDAFSDGAGLLFAIDADDPQHEAYGTALMSARLRAAPYGSPVGISQYFRREMLVPKLNRATMIALLDGPFAVGFAGDDHLPRTRHWARDYLDALRILGTGFVSCPDGYRSDRLPTQWAMTADIPHALGGRQVPAPVEHLYCDDAVRDLAVSSGSYAYLDAHLIEHMHPVTGKVTGDAQHAEVNAPKQYAHDRRAYREWQRSAERAEAVMTIEGLRKGEILP